MIITETMADGSDVLLLAGFSLLFFLFAFAVIVLATTAVAFTQ
jgi:hypothetical protein